jgi:hypothetical protein
MACAVLHLSPKNAGRDTLTDGRGIVYSEMTRNFLPFHAREMDRCCEKTPAITHCSGSRQAFTATSKYGLPTHETGRNSRVQSRTELENKRRCGGGMDLRATPRRTALQPLSHDNQAELATRPFETRDSAGVALAPAIAPSLNLKPDRWEIQSTVQRAMTTRIRRR